MTRNGLRAPSPTNSPYKFNYSFTELRNSQKSLFKENNHLESTASLKLTKIEPEP